MNDYDPFLSIRDMAILLGRAEATIRTDVTRRPHTLPPVTRLPGSNRIRWHKDVVDEWIEMHTAKNKADA